MSISTLPFYSSGKTMLGGPDINTRAISYHWTIDGRHHFRTVAIFNHERALWTEEMEAEFQATLAALSARLKKEI